MSELNGNGFKLTDDENVKQKEHKVNFQQLIERKSKKLSCLSLCENQNASNFKSFRIEPDEKVLGLIERKESLFSSQRITIGVVTDRSIAMRDKNGNFLSRVEYTEICKYIVWDYGNVKLISQDEEIELHKIGINIISTAGLGGEIGELVTEIQSAMYDSWNISRQQRGETYTWVEIKAIADLAKGELSDYTKELLKLTARDKLFTIRAYYYISQDSIVRLDRSSFFYVLKEIEQLNCKNIIKENIKKQCKKYMEYVSDFSKEYDEKYVKSLLINARYGHYAWKDYENADKELYDFFSGKFLPYVVECLELRQDELDVSDFFRKTLKYTSTPEAMESAILRKIANYDKCMLGYFKSIRNGKVPEYGDITLDSLGFDLIDYAIICKQSSIAKKLTTDFSKKGFPQRQSFDNPMLEKIYDYSFLSSILGMTDLATYMIDYSSEMKGIIDARESVKLRLKLYRAAHTAISIATDVGRRNVSAGREYMRRGAISSDDFYEKAEKLDGLQDKKYEMEEQIHEYERELREIEEEIATVRKSCIENLSQDVNEIKQSSDALIKFLLFLAQNPAEFERILGTDIQNKSVYCTGKSFL